MQQFIFQNMDLYPRAPFQTNSYLYNVNLNQKVKSTDTFYGHLKLLNLTKDLLKSAKNGMTS